MIINNEVGERMKLKAKIFERGMQFVLALVCYFQGWLMIFADRIVDSHGNTTVAKPQLPIVGFPLIAFGTFLLLDIFLGGKLSKRITAYLWAKVIGD